MQLSTDPKMVLDKNIYIEDTKTPNELRQLAKILRVKCLSDEYHLILDPDDKNIQAISVFNGIEFKSLTANQSYGSDKMIYYTEITKRLVELVKLNTNLETLDVTIDYMEKGAMLSLLSAIRESTSLKDVTLDLEANVPSQDIEWGIYGAVAHNRNLQKLSIKLNKAPTDFAHMLIFAVRYNKTIESIELGYSMFIGTDLKKCDDEIVKLFKGKQLKSFTVHMEMYEGPIAVEAIDYNFWEKVYSIADADKPKIVKLPELALRAISNSIAINGVQFLRPPNTTIALLLQFIDSSASPKEVTSLEFPVETFASNPPSLVVNFFEKLFIRMQRLVSVRVTGIAGAISVTDVWTNVVESAAALSVALTDLTLPGISPEAIADALSLVAIRNAEFQGSGFGWELAKAFRAEEWERSGYSLDLGEKLGNGSFGTVHIATEIATGKKVAVKTNEEEKNAACEMRTEFLFRYSKLYRPNVMRIEGVFVDKDENILTVMELMEGGDLAHAIEQDVAKIPRIEALFLLRQIAKALVYIHANGLAHNDVATRNIFLNKDWTVAKLGDFGLTDTEGRSWQPLLEAQEDDIQMLYSVWTEMFSPTFIKSWVGPSGDGVYIFTGATTADEVVRRIDAIIPGHIGRDAHLKRIGGPDVVPYAPLPLPKENEVLYKRMRSFLR